MQCSFEADQNVSALMIGKAGPFQVIEGDGQGTVERPIPAPKRKYCCQNYTVCLDLAAALNWDSFTCRGCCGEVDNSLLWRAHLARKRDSIVETLCSIPEIPLHQIPTHTSSSSCNSCAASSEQKPNAEVISINRASERLTAPIVYKIGGKR